MANVLFIGESALKDASIINENVDMKLLQPTIKMAQEKYILAILGTALYNDLVTEIDGASVSADNQTLLNDYIQPALIAWVKFESIPVLQYKFMNKGIFKKSSESAQPIDLSEIHFVMDRAKNDAEWYSERVTKFLCANTDTYPLFINPGSDSDTVHPNSSNYQTGIYLD